VARAASSAPGSPMQAVAKRSVDKIYIGGRKYAVRRLSARGTAEAEIVGVGVPPKGDTNDRPLQVQLVKNGEIVGEESLETIRQRHLRSRAELPLEALRMSWGEPVIETIRAGTDEVPISPYQTTPVPSYDQQPT
jgi:nicotinate phosphoribosyltransferase